MAQKDVMRFLRNLSRACSALAVVQLDEAERKKIIDESGGILRPRRRCFSAETRTRSASYLNEDEATAQQIQRV